MIPNSISMFRNAADEIGQEGANRLFRNSLEGRLHSYPMETVGQETDEINSVGHALGWQLLELARNENQNAFWADLAENCLVIVADLNGPMGIRIPLRKEGGE